VLAGCVEVAADGVTVAGAGLGAEPAADFLLCFRRPQVALGLVRRRGDAGVGEEPQHVGFPVAEAFQQGAAGLLPGVRAGDPGDLRQPDDDRAAEKLQVSGGIVGGDAGQALVPGDVGGVDQRPQRLGRLAGPDGARVGLGGVFQVPEQVLVMAISP
jgi:hypothetical protein